MVIIWSRLMRPTRITSRYILCCCCHSVPWAGYPTCVRASFMDLIRICHGVRLLCSRAQGHVRRTGEGLGEGYGGGLDEGLGK